MALGIYTETSPSVYEQHSESGAQTNPVTTVHHGRSGDTFEKKLYVRADNSNTYTNIQVQPQSKTEDDDIGSGSSRGSSGWGVKLIAQDDEPTEVDWEAADYGAAVDITDISDNSTYVPFWYRIESPSGLSVENKDNIALVILCTETP
jgi:hypothetical protein